MRGKKSPFALVMVVCLGLIGCGENKPPQESSPQPPPETTASEATEAGDLGKEAEIAVTEETPPPPVDKGEEPAEVSKPGEDPDAGGAEGEAEVVEMAALEVTSARFEHEGAIPREFTCDGADVSPPLEWSAGPEGTQSYALIMDDPDAPRGTWVHWVVWNIPKPSLVDVIPAREKLDDGTMQGVNSWPKLGYGGPCPPSGTHRYFFKVYALDAPLDLPGDTTKEDLLEAMEGHILAQGELMGKYARVK